MCIRDSIRGATGLAWLAVHGKRAVGAAESSYGIFVRGAGTVVTLSDVHVIASNGGAGADGSTGADGQVGGRCAGATGAAGTHTGAAGVAAAPGAFTRT